MIVSHTSTPSLFCESNRKRKNQTQTADKRQRCSVSALLLLGFHDCWRRLPPYLMLMLIHATCSAAFGIRFSIE